MPSEEPASSSPPAPSPKEEKKSSEPARDVEPTPGTTTDPAGESSQASSSSSAPRGKPANQKYPLYPSVAQLLHVEGVSESEAAKIPASGPKGRLLKGDVLAYLGKTSSKDYAAKQSERLEKLGHLDLSNIKIRPPPAAPAEKAAAKAEAVPEELPTEIAVSISLGAVFATQKRIQESLGLVLPISTFIARASEMANEDLPRPKSDSLTSDSLFNAVLGLDKVRSARVSRGHYVPQITAMPPAGVAASVGLAAAARAAKKVDIIDVLAGKASKKSVGPLAVTGAVGAASGAGGAVNIFSVAAKKGEEKRVRTYLERVKTVLEVEPGKCVL